MHIRKFFSAAFLLFASASIHAQLKSDPVVLQVGPEKVHLSEFETMFKKNMQKDQTITKEALDEYLDLFTYFKLKVLAAKEAGVDTTKSFNMEFNGYRKQLGYNYMKDSIAEKKLAQQMAERSQLDLHVKHILIQTPNDCDTLAAYKKAMDVYNRLNKGMKWDNAVKTYSDDTYSNKSDGDLGWFSAGMWAYNFENAAYGMKNGGFSKPVRSKNGYHIIHRVNSRKARGEVKVAHIFVSALEADKEAVEKGKTKIQEAYSLLKNGEEWTSVLGRFSEDRASAAQNGELAPFGIGFMVAPFEDAAFALKNIGDFSEPIQTKFGWHILRLVEKSTPPTYAENPKFYSSKMDKSQQYKALLQAGFASSVKDELEINEMNTYWNALNRAFDKKDFPASKLDSLPDMTLFSIDGVNYSVEDFKAYYRPRLPRTVDVNVCQMKERYYLPFLYSKISENYELKLEDKYPDFKALMKEFKEGMMQFELMKKQVWDKSIEDTSGLRSYFEANRNNYMWGERNEAVLFTGADSTQLASLYKSFDKIAQNPDLTDKFLKKVNKKETRIAHTIILEEKSNKDGLILTNIGSSAKRSNVFASKNNYNVLVLTGERQPEPKELKEVKGAVISNYQEHLEKVWLQELKAKYPVQADKNVLYQLIQK